MQWNFKLNGKPVVLEIADALAAVPPSRASRPHAPREKDEIRNQPGKSGQYGKYVPYAPPIPKRAVLDLQVYERRGWEFIDPAQSAGITDVRQVYFSESDDLLIETKLITVQLTQDYKTKPIPPEKVLAEDGLQIVHRLSSAPNLFAVRVISNRPLPETIEKLQRRTDRYVFAEPSLLQIISGRLTPSDPDFVDQWQHATVPRNGAGGFGLNSAAAWNITRGAGPDRPVRVAIIDNGMDINHADLEGAIIGGGFFRSNEPGSGTADFVRIEPGMTDFPPLGHGTFCLGMVGGRQNNDNGGCGIAPESALIAIACANDQIGTQLTLARAVEFAVNPRQVDPESQLDAGADVISCSLKTANILESVLRIAIDSAASGRGGLGIPIFWAVSNNRFNKVSDDKICSLENVIAVGRSNRQGQPAGSATGPKLEFLAPGQDVFGPSQGDHNVSASGTSFATPLAAGVAALVLSLHPDWTADEVRQHLRETCDNPNGSNRTDQFGFGRLNALRAVQT